MYDDLIVMTFNRREEALQAWMGLDMMRGRQSMGLEKAAAVRKDKAGRTTICQSWEIGDYPHSEETQILRLFADAVFGSSGSKSRRQLAESGLDPAFLNKMVSAFGPDSSALLFYIPRESLVDTGLLLDILMKMRGTLHHTTFTSAVTQTILKQGWLTDIVNS